MRVRLDLAYDGSGFYGWASQPGLRTVQGEIESALGTILRLDPPPRLTVAGRTDAGVHARGQVAHVDVDGIAPPVLEYRLRRLLDRDITLHRLTAAPEGFNARFSAIERRYVYRIMDGLTDPLMRGHVVRWTKKLDIDAMNAAAEHLLGLHDFASFCKKREGATTIRTLRELRTRRAEDGTVETTVRADAFCHSMVRSIMGVLVSVAEHRYEPAWAGHTLDKGFRPPDVRVMPAHGLVLEQVVYASEEEMAARAATARRRRGL